MKTLLKVGLVSLAIASTSAFADSTTQLGNVSVPNTLNYGNSFNSTATQSTFYDAFVFTITGADTNSITSSINLANFLGTGDLKARLLVGDTNTTASSISLGNSVVLENWGTTVTLAPNVSQTTVVLAPVTLAAGTYTLQIKGTVTGAFGGSYAGVMNFTNPATVASVPEPQTNAMLLAGVVLIGFIANKRKNSI